MNYLYPASRVIVAGVTETGKTTFAERYIRSDKTNDKILIYDWQDFEFARRLGISPITDWEDLGKRYEQERILCFDPMGEEAETVENISDFLFSVNADCKHEVLFVGDEFGGILDHKKLLPTTKDLLTKGRRWQLNCLLILHQFNEINYVMRNHVTEVATFRQVDHLATKAASTYYSDIDTEILQTLGTGEYYYRNIKTNSPSERHQLFS